MKQLAGLYRLYKVGSEEWQDFKEHERADMLAEGWCEVPNSQPVEPETVEPTAKDAKKRKKRKKRKI